MLCPCCPHFDRPSGEAGDWSWRHDVHVGIRRHPIENGCAPTSRGLPNLASGNMAGSFMRLFLSLEHHFREMVILAKSCAAGSFRPMRLRPVGLFELGPFDFGQFDLPQFDLGQWRLFST